MKAVLGLGANLGDRAAALETALTRLDQDASIHVLDVSSVYETRAVLPPDAPGEWDLPYLNAAAVVETGRSPLELLDACQAIERNLGRGPHTEWSPRTIDVDIVTTDGPAIATTRLELPHPRAAHRPFVLAPAAEIVPGWRLHAAGRTVTELRHDAEALPSWMQIINATPDSFSGDGLGAVGSKGASVASGANYVDVGAESTRPGADPVSPAEERGRLECVLDAVRRRSWVGPRLSIDTRHASTAAWALDYGAHVINDVSGLVEPAMLDVLAPAHCDVVLMHSTTVPADPRQTLDPSRDPVDAVEDWLTRRLDELVDAGIALDRVLVDPGIGFGKTPDHSVALLRAAKRLQRFGLRLLYGHSRKSFMKRWADVEPVERDVETLAISAYLAGAGVDVLRVHALERHRRSWRVTADLA